MLATFLHVTATFLSVTDTYIRTYICTYIMKIDPGLESSLCSQLYINVHVNMCSLDQSHLWDIYMGFFFGRTFTQDLKITGEKHAGNLGVGDSIAQKNCALVPCA